MQQQNLIKLSNNKAECQISLWGGQIVSYRPKTEQHDVFWLGNLNKFDNKSAIRGGIPVCWPRFAAEELNKHFPRHGFARISLWKLQNITVDDETIEVELSLRPETQYHIDLTAELLIKITDQFECSLKTTNIGTETIKFSEALHTYFNVGDRDKTIIKGLSGCSYKSSLDGKVYTLHDDLQVHEEFDASFFNNTRSVIIEDKVLNRIITLTKGGSNSTIIWNPNKDLAEMSTAQYKHFVCVEAANQGDNFVTLQPQETHIISMNIAVNKSST